jgi:hypothetical protein
MHTKSPFSFVLGMTMKMEQTLVQCDPVNEKYSPLFIHTLKDMALRSNRKGFGCPYVKPCAVSKKFRLFYMQPQNSYSVCCERRFRIKDSHCERNIILCGVY